MIRFIEKIIKDKLGDTLNLNDKHLSFVKYSTPLSGDGSGGKVLFFVFVGRSKNPSLIIKTVRRYKEAFVIKNGYNNLKKLNDVVMDTEYSSIFPKALYMYDDSKEFVFSVESVCGGEKALKKRVDINNIVEKYTDFQKSIYTGEKVGSLGEYGESLIKQLDLGENDENMLIRYFEEIVDDKGLELAKIRQHGDLTVDNVLIDRGNIHIIDCDLFGKVELAGYDMYRFLRRYYKINLVTSLNNYFDRVGVNIKANTSVLFLYYLNELLFKKDYILKNKTGKDIIDEFKKIK